MSSVLIEDMKKYLSENLDLEHTENHSYGGEVTTHKIRLKLGDLVLKEVEFDTHRSY